MRKVRGKQVWGTTRYFINIDLYTNVFSPSMSGHVYFYDTRGLIAEKDCRNLHELVRAVYEFWSTILAPHQTRVARWLEEYLTEKGIPSDYRLILKLIKTEEISEKPLDAIVETPVEVENTSYLDALKIKENSTLRAIKSKMKQRIEDEFEITDIVQKIMNTHSLKVHDTVKRTYQYQLGAEDIIQQDVFNIEVGGKIGEYIVKTVIKNKYDTELTNIKITDLLPFHYKLESINIDQNYTTQRQKEGTEILWSFEKLNSGEELTIEYRLSKRIKRTILEILYDEVYMLESFIDIEPHGLDFGSTLTYVNTHPNVVEYLFIFDEIPAEYKIIRTDPDAIPPIGMIEKPRMRGTIVRWKHKNVKPKDSLNKTYLMDYYPYIIRTVSTIRNKSGKELLKGLKLLKILTGEQGYKIIYIIKSLISTGGVITVSDRIPKTDVIITRDPPESQVMIDETDPEGKKITWVTKAPDKNQYTKLMLYVTGSVTPIVGHMQIQLEDLGEAKLIERKTSIKRELIPENIEEKLKNL